VIYEKRRDAEQPLKPSRRPHSCVCQAAVIAAVSLFCLWVLAGPSPRSPAEEQAKALLRSKPDGFGTCPTQPSLYSEPLRWGAQAGVADHICCKNRVYAEYHGYWKRTTLPLELPRGEKEIVFYDVSTSRPLFIAPRGRTYSAFIQESTRHGWPSFRDEEVVWPNVVVLHGGETVSINGTHLGHNLPDAEGNRYCIDIVCIAGHPLESAHGE